LDRRDFGVATMRQLRTAQKLIIEDQKRLMEKVR
jgi:hypothetical protein